MDSAAGKRLWLGTFGVDPVDPRGRAAHQASSEDDRASMDSFTVNKIAGAVLGTCLFGMGLGILSEAIYFPGAPKKPGYALPELQEVKAEAVAQPAEAPLPVLLAKADAHQGRGRRQGVHRLPQLPGRRRHQGRPGPLRRRRPAQGLGRRLRLFRRPEGKGRELDLRRHQPVPHQAVGLHLRHQDGLRRPGERGEARRHPRLPADPVEGAGALSAGGRRRQAGVRRWRRQGSGNPGRQGRGGDG